MDPEYDPPNPHPRCPRGHFVAPLPTHLYIDGRPGGYAYIEARYFRAADYPKDVDVTPYWYCRACNYTYDSEALA
jgi:hypothetical protein